MHVFACGMWPPVVGADVGRIDSYRTVGDQCGVDRFGGHRRVWGLLSASWRVGGNRSARISVRQGRVPAMSTTELCNSGKRCGYSHQWGGSGKAEV